jgi:hypothetical protein
VRNQPLKLPWDEPGWHGQAAEWIADQLAANGWNAVGPVETVHQRIWSIFMRVPTNRGAAFFKAPAPPFYEAPLTQALDHWRPDCTVPLMGVELKRGWLLSADAGSTLRSIGQTPAQVEHWLKALPIYAGLQIEMAEHVGELLSFGTPDRRLAVLPDLYSWLMAETDSLRIGQELGLTPEEHRDLLDLRPRFAELCAELDSLGLPATLAHEEIHENNVLFDGERYVFTDWSDSSVAHPFFTMTVTLRATAYWLKLDEFGPEMMRMRDAYLEPWTKFATREKLLPAFKLAYRLGMVNRALSWNAALRSLTEKQIEPYNDSVPGWLQDFLNAEIPRKE